MRSVMRNAAAGLGLTLMLWGCGSAPEQGREKDSDLLRRWNAANNPDLMEDRRHAAGDYVTVLSKLPSEAELETVPWSGDYWPTHKGGITYRWNDKGSKEVDRYSYRFLTKKQIKKMSRKQLARLSPAEKFDIYMGRYHMPLTRYERRRTQIMKTVEGSPEYDKKFKIPTWEGLCHSWAPATLAYKEPHAVTVRGRYGVKVPFGSSDIKALLTYFLHIYDGNVNFLGSRCDVDMAELTAKYHKKEVTKAYYEQQKRACADTNAGAFHVVLTNQIGRMKQGFIADITREAEVWNQAVFRYTSEFGEPTEGASKNAARGTVKEVEVVTTMYYIDEVNHSWKPSKENRVSTKRYHYRLELNKRGEIIGGEWHDDKADRPDFLWKQTIPRFRGFFWKLGKLYRDATR